MMFLLPQQIVSIYSISHSDVLIDKKSHGETFSQLTSISAWLLSIAVFFASAPMLVRQVWKNI